MTNLYSKKELAVNKKPLGISLIEVLVALIVLSIGVLGLTNLQVAANNASQQNHLFSQASLISSNLSNRLQLNKNSIFNAQDLGLTSPYLLESSFNFLATNNCNFSKFNCFCLTQPFDLKNCRSSQQQIAVNCSSEELSLFDIYEINCLLVMYSNHMKLSLTAQFIESDLLSLNIHVLWPNSSATQLVNNADCESAKQRLGITVSTHCYSENILLTGRNL